MNTSLTTPRVRRDLFATPFGSLFDEFFGEFMSPDRWTPLLGRLPGELPAVMRPRMDVIDKGSAYEVVVDLPGVRKDDINVAIEGAWITINAEAKGSQESKNGDRLLHSERWACAYSRSFELPSEVTEAGADAKFENGVLRLTLPKREPAAVKRLTVH
jgi:HSP20 family protein